MRWAHPLLGAAFLFATIPALVSANDEQAVTAVESLGAKLSSEALDSQRGGEMIINEIDERADLFDNSAINNVTGSNFITDNAFGGAAGLPVAVQNTGNNVIIQNSFIVNLQMQ